jgi:hypothetical protein
MVVVVNVVVDAVAVVVVVAVEVAVAVVDVVKVIFAHASNPSGQVPQFA